MRTEDHCARCFSPVFADHTMKPWRAREIESEADLEIRRAHIAEHLQRVTLLESVCHLVFHNDPVVDDHVNHLSSKRFAAIIDHDRDFSVDVVASGYQLSLEGKGVDVFAVAASKPSVDLVKGPDDRLRERFVEESAGTP